MPAPPWLTAPTGSRGAASQGEQRPMPSSMNRYNGGYADDRAQIEDLMARYLFAIARNDDAQEPATKTALRSAADAARATAEIEVYPADHGWCVIDTPAYDPAEADRAWDRMLALFAQL